MKAGMAGMMGMSNNMASLNQGALQNSAGDQQNDSKRQIDSFNQLHNGGDRSASGDNQFMTRRSMSPSALNMLRAGGFPGAQAAQNQFRAGAQGSDMDAGMFGGDRYGQQLRGAFPGGQFGLNPAAAGMGQFGPGGSRGGQPSFMQAYGQGGFGGAGAQFGSDGSNAGFSGGGAGGGGMGGGDGNPTLDGMAQMLGMSGQSSRPPQRNQGNHSSQI